MNGERFGVQHATHGCECGERAMKKEKKRGKGVIDFTEKRDTDSFFQKRGKREKCAFLCCFCVEKMKHFVFHNCDSLTD